MHQFNESDKCNANSYLRSMVATVQKLESKLICANRKEANVSTHSDNSCMKSSGHGGYDETEDETDKMCLKSTLNRESQKVIAIPFCLQLLYPPHLISPLSHQQHSRVGQSRPLI